MKNGIMHEIENTRSVDDPDSPLKTASAELLMIEASETPPLLGFQFCNAAGENIAGRDGDPSGLADFEILAPDLAIELCRDRPKGWPYLLQPIYVGDIEEANIVFANGLWVKF